MMNSFCSDCLKRCFCRASYQTVVYYCPFHSKFYVNGVCVL